MFSIALNFESVTVDETHFLGLIAKLLVKQNDPQMPWAIAAEKHGREDETVTQSKCLRIIRSVVHLEITLRIVTPLDAN